MCSQVPEVDKLKAKLIAGRIIPAIATATAAATGEQDPELGDCMGPTWDQHGTCMGVAWMELHGTCMGLAWRSHEKAEVCGWGGYAFSNVVPYIPIHHPVHMFCRVISCIDAV